MTTKTEEKDMTLKIMEKGLETQTEFAKSFHCLEKYLKIKYKGDDELIRQLSEVNHKLLAVHIHQIIESLNAGALHTLAFQNTIKRWTTVPGLRCSSCGKFIKESFEDALKTK